MVGRVSDIICVSSVLAMVVSGLVEDISNHEVQTCWFCANCRRERKVTPTRGSFCLLGYLGLVVYFRCGFFVHWSIPEKGSGQNHRSVPCHCRRSRW
jgi:hypothetical protein